MIDISIVVPAYNEEKFIVQTIRRLVEVLEPTNVTYEILVIDNGSTDTTAQLISTLEGVRVVTLHQRGTISEARNCGARESRGPLLAFIDADVLVTATWAAAVRAKHQEIALSANAVTGSQYLVSEDPGWIERYWFKAMEERIPNYINGGNLIVSRKLFDRVGGFQSDLVTGEDVEFCRRAKRYGAHIYPDREFVVHHEGYPKGILKFVRREIWAGRGDFSSLSAFAQSRTAQTAVVVVLMIVSILATALLGLWKLSLVLAAIVILIAIASVIHKYGFHSYQRLIVNSAVMIIHLVARFFGFVKLEKKM